MNFAMLEIYLFPLVCLSEIIAIVYEHTHTKVITYEPLLL